MWWKQETNRCRPTGSAELSDTTVLVDVAVGWQESSVVLNPEAEVRTTLLKGKDGGEWIICALAGVKHEKF
jgi:hypothetical protein